MRGFEARGSVRWFRGVVLAAFLLSAASGVQGLAYASPRTVSIANVARSMASLPLDADRRVVIGVLDASRMSDVAATLAALGATVEQRYSWNAYLVVPPAGEDAAAFAGVVRGLGGVRYARPDRMVRAAAVPNDPSFPLQWGLARIGGPDAWTVAGGSGVRIALIDTGIDTTNLDLASQVTTGTAMVSPGSTDYTDDNGHGTHVAGIAAAIADNGLGIAGTAPNAQLVVVKVLDSQGAGYESNVAAGVRWAVDHGANVISMSFATTDPRGIDAVTYARTKGCLVVAAAGNTGGSQRVWPAAYDGVLAVGATDELDRRASFSTTGTRADGSTTTMISAPGTGILSWYLRHDLALMSGTSMATPFVSGAAAVVWSANPTWNAAQVSARLTSTALDLPPAGRDSGTGYGRLRLDAALGRPVAPDAYEPDGTPAQASAALRLLAVSSGAPPEWHDLAPSGDTDVACVDLVAGARYVVATSELSGGADTAIQLLAPDGTTLLGANDDVAPGNPASVLDVRAPQTGRYFVVVTDPRLRGGGYLLTAQTAPVAPQATSIAIWSTNRRPRYRRSFTLMGTLTPGTPGRAVVLEVLAPRSRRWVSAARATYGATAAGGTVWSCDFRPARRGTYKFRVRFAGDADYFGSVSRVISVRVR